MSSESLLVLLLLSCWCGRVGAIIGVMIMLVVWLLVFVGVNML